MKVKDGTMFVHNIPLPVPVCLSCVLVEKNIMGTSNSEKIDMVQLKIGH